eukprot:2356040-Rhodomonas_salina.1
MEELKSIPAHIELPPCESCARARSKRKPLPKATYKRHTKPLYMLHSDMSGKIRTKGMNGASYFVTFTDDASNYKIVRTMDTKDQFIATLHDVILVLGRAPNYLRTDNACEMSGDQAKRFYKSNRILHQTCNAHAHWGNGRAESTIGNLSSRARGLMSHAGAPAAFWPHALVYAAEIENRLMPSSSKTNNSAYFEFHGVHPDNSKIVTWGCQAWLWRDRHRRVDQRWDNTAISCVCLGFAYHYGKKGWLLLSLGDKPAYHVSTNVSFNEGVLPLR